jgi:hypothetical protein
MSGSNEDDKATVVLDLNALKKQKMKQEEELANIGQELVFNVGKDDDGALAVEEEFLSEELPEEEKLKEQFPIIFFDLQSDFFKKNFNTLPRGYNYKIITTLEELNQNLKSKSFQILVLNYDVNPKAVNQVSAQVKTKFPFTKTLISAKAISSEKAKLHMKTASGANGYYQLPMEAARFEIEINKIKSKA